MAKIKRCSFLPHSVYCTVHYNGLCLWYSFRSCSFNIHSYCQQCYYQTQRYKSYSLVSLADRPTIDIILSVGLLQVEIHLESNRPLNLTCLITTVAFDSVG